MIVDSVAPYQRPLVVVPTYNERDNLEPIVRAVLSYVPHAVVWVVDDNSPDGTGQIADRIAAREPRVEVIHRAAKLGLGTAYVEAYQRALAHGFDCLVQMDADFSHDPSYLPRLVAALERADMVLGSRYVPGGGTRNWSKVRQLISRGGNVVARLGLGIRTRDATGGFRAFRRRTLEHLQMQHLDLRGYGFQIEVVFQVERAGLCIEEVPITFVERVSGKSKMSKGIALEAFLYIVRRRLATLRQGAPVDVEKPGALLEKR